MRLNEALFQLFENKARTNRVDQICLGLGYSAVATSDGGMGIAYTSFEDKLSCLMHKKYENPEGKSAIGLLEKIFSKNSLDRTMALALINALNANTVRSLLAAPDYNPGESALDNQNLLDMLSVNEGTTVAMVGAFKPIIGLIKQRRAQLEVVDVGKKIGEPKGFIKKLDGWAEVLIITSTTLLNNTTEEILDAAGNIRGTVLLGPSTPLVKEAFVDLPVHFLAGTLPVDKEATFRAVRHGTGTPVIQKFGKKVLLQVHPPQLVF